MSVNKSRRFRCFSETYVFSQYLCTVEACGQKRRGAAWHVIRFRPSGPVRHASNDQERCLRYLKLGGTYRSLVVRGTSILERHRELCTSKTTSHTSIFPVQTSYTAP